LLIDTLTKNKAGNKKREKILFGCQIKGKINKINRNAGRERHGVKKASGKTTGSAYITAPFSLPLS